MTLATKKIRKQLQAPHDPKNLNSLIAFITTMAQTVHKQVENSIRALLEKDEGLAGAIALNEPRVNALEIVIDEYAVRTIVGRALPEEDVRLIVATIKINNDLERMGDLAVNIAQRVITLGDRADAELPKELVEMVTPVQEILRKSLTALVEQDILLANEVLTSDEEVDAHRDRVFEMLLSEMAHQPDSVNANFQLLLVARYLERIADHATNIAEDIIYWVRGVDVRHRKGEAPAIYDFSRED